MLEHLVNVEVLRSLVREVVREVLEEHEVGGVYLTPVEAAAVAKLKPATIREWIKRGRLRASRVGRGIRVTRSDLDHAIASWSRGQRRETDEEWARREVRRSLGKGAR